MDVKRKITNNDYSDVMLNRHSFRSFLPNIKISNEEITEMLKEAATAPSACNLQSWHFVVCNTPESREKAHALMMPYNYPQEESCSTVIFAFGNSRSYLNYREVWNQATEKGQITVEERDDMYKTFMPFYENADHDFLEKGATIDTSMAVMQLLLSARAHGYEADAISGYYASKSAAAFNLDPARFVPIAAVAIGKPSDGYVESSRYEVSDFTDFA